METGFLKSEPLYTQTSLYLLRARNAGPVGGSARPNTASRLSAASLSPPQALFESESLKAFAFSWQTADQEWQL